MDPKPNSPRISLRDIAKQLGVSHSTVSLALRNHPRISEAVRDKVRDAAAALGYQPDPMLTALAYYRKAKSAAPISAALAWINAWSEPEKLRSYREFDAYWNGASQAAAKFGYRVEEFRLGGEYSPQRLHQILSTRGIRGIFLPPHQADPDWGNFPWENYSVMRFGRSLHHPRTHLVTADQVTNTMLAFERMLALGYRRIGFVTKQAHMSERGHLFEAGYLIAQRLIEEKHRLPAFSTFGMDRKTSQNQLLAWVRKNKPDAIFTDIPGIPALLDAAGLRVPEDIGVAATTLLDTGADSGIDQHPEEIGRCGFLLLNSLINDGARGIPPIFRQVLVEGEWVDGNSLPPRDHATGNPSGRSRRSAPH